MKSFLYFLNEEKNIPKNQIGSWDQRNGDDRDKKYFWATEAGRTVVIDRNGTIAAGDGKGKSLKSYATQIIRQHKEEAKTQKKKEEPKKTEAKKEKAESKTTPASKEEKEKSTRDSFIEKLKKEAPDGSVEIKGKQIILNVNAGGDRSKRLELAQKLCKKFDLSIQDGKTKSGTIAGSGGYNLKINDSSKSSGSKVSGSAATQYNLKTHYLSSKLDNSSTEPWNTGSTEEIISEVEKSFKTSELPDEAKKAVTKSLSLLKDDVSNMSEDEFAEKYHESMKAVTATGLMSSANEVLYPAVLMAAKSAKNKEQAVKNIKKVLGEKALSTLFKCSPEEVDSYLTDSSLEVSFPKDQNNGTYDFQISTDDHSAIAFGEDKSKADIKQAVKRCIGVSVKHGEGVGTNLNHLVENWEHLSDDRRSEISKSAPLVGTLFGAISDKSNKEPRPVMMTRIMLQHLKGDIKEKTGMDFDVDKFMDAVKAHKKTDKIEESSDFDEFEKVISAYSKKNSIFTTDGFPTSIYYCCMKYASNTINSNNAEKNALADIFNIPDVVQLSSTNNGGMSIFDLSNVRADAFKAETKTVKSLFNSKYVPLTLAMGSSKAIAESITTFLDYLHLIED